MNKQELINKLQKLLTTPSEISGYDFDDGYDFGVESAISLAKDLDESVIPPEPEKPVVPQVAVEFYERYKGDNLSLGEWFGDFYSPEAIEEFPRMDELTKWLYDNNDEINRQREFALATLVTLGIDAVEVEKEKLYTVEIPNPNGNGYRRVYLGRDKDNKIKLQVWDCFPSIEFSNDWKQLDVAQLTEAEIKKDFEWAFRWAKEVEE